MSQAEAPWKVPRPLPSNPPAAPHTAWFHCTLAPDRTTAPPPNSYSHVFKACDSWQHILMHIISLILRYYSELTGPRRYSIFKERAMLTPEE